ncbi:uncharacterized protein SPAPADRAFT_151830 [Spathaspora passalidarum NRRL Y-27907]|uniref:CCR4-Not complex component Not N-terminal domain-containing protein n=1 Tax=Spathaspora passalidarum (strain NRRL Y-27907 / 11-Y1) TaxID=619300 RepID=G3AK91_SPAPN|nr:uncharacterized protein SPAPADRAFT_151830 [Spathaspora passalidarum NRRL Y-27907]EGW33550.1 hypothetical protein SPAPADRAFT_151830 [Spathaspora passalidarum NRRL Y-27907]
MANRKLQKDIEIIFKKIQEGLHEFHYHYDRYESINTDEDSDNQREKEKLEGDLKKEIKRLQKFREQIKNWQSNDVIKTLGLPGNALGVKLNDNKKLIEEAMEIYKDVERSSKLKTFSNQSIMMAFMDSQHGDDDDDDDEDTDEEFLEHIDSSDEDEEEDYADLPSDAIEAIQYLKDTIIQIRDSTQKLNHEYEKLAQKKLRKNNLTTIEAKKEKIQATIENNKFHCKKILKLIRLLKANRVNEFGLIWLLKDDLDEYVSSNGDSNFSSETTLYEDIFNSIVAADQDYSEIYEEKDDDSQTLDSTTNGSILSETNSHPQKLNGHADAPQPRQQSQQSAHPLQQPPQPQLQQQPNSPDLSSPGIVRTLKPAATPSKPVGNLKWAAAAAVGIPETSTTKSRSQEPESNGSHQPDSSPTHRSSVTSSSSPEQAKVQAAAQQQQQQQHQQHQQHQQQQRPLVVENINLDKYKAIVQNSSLPKTEVNLFSDMNLIRVPPGIQDLVISFASKRNHDECKLLVNSTEFNQFTTPIRKKYLPSVVQPLNLSFTPGFRHPTQLMKFQSIWNQIRATYGFEKLVNEIKSLASQDKPDNAALVAELTYVLFYGFYYGLTPAENLIAESYLFDLGWKPYKAQLDNNSSSPLHISSPTVKDDSKSAAPTGSYWFKRIKLISEGTTANPGFEFGDYQVFDLNFWEIFVRYGFKFDYTLCQFNPSTSIF